MHRRPALALLAAALVLPALAAPATADEADTVRARRLAYNRAIAERSADDLPGFVTPGFVQLSSNGALTVGADKVRALYAGQEFRDPAFIAYDRQPDSVVISANGRFAIERGHWRGRFRDGKGGETGNTGLYQAGWLKQDGEWRVRTEHYVRLTCASESDCP